MRRYAVIVNCMVVNVVLWDGEAEWQPAEGVAVECPEHVSPGWLHDGAVFSPPPEPE